MKTATTDLDGIPVLPQGELLLREATNEILEYLALERRPASTVNRGRALGHDRHIKVGGHHPHSVFLSFGENAGEYRDGGSVLNHTLKDRKLLEDQVPLQFEFHQPPFLTSTKD